MSGSGKGMRKSMYKSPPSGATGSGGDNNTNVQSNRKSHINTVPTKRRGGKSK